MALSFQLEMNDLRQFHGTSTPAAILSLYLDCAKSRPVRRGGMTGRSKTISLSAGTATCLTNKGMPKFGTPRVASFPWRRGS